jgi:hypothetical protein
VVLPASGWEIMANVRRRATDFFIWSMNLEFQSHLKEKRWRHSHFFLYLPDIL